MTKKILVIGAGLFGCIIARHLRRWRGYEVRLVDCNAPWGASKAAGCLIRPSWLSKMTVSQQSAAFELLAAHYNLRELDFRVAGLKTAKLRFVSPDEILSEERETAEVINIGMHQGKPWAKINSAPYDGAHYDVTPYDAIITATGIAADKFFPGFVPGLKSQWGISYRVLGQVPENTLAVWAPYRQLLKFNISESEIWLGDGAAWREIEPKHALGSLDRAKTALDLDPETLLKGRRVGARPYCPPTPGDPCFLKEIGPGLWIATGGAKNGTMAAAWAAYTLGERLK